MQRQITEQMTPTDQPINQSTDSFFNKKKFSLAPLAQQASRIDRAGGQAGPRHGVQVWRLVRLLGAGAPPAKKIFQI